MILHTLIELLWNAGKILAKFLHAFVFVAGLGFVLLGTGSVYKEQRQSERQVFQQHADQQVARWENNMQHALLRMQGLAYWIDVGDSLQARHLHRFTQKVLLKQFGVVGVLWADSLGTVRWGDGIGISDLQGKKLDALSWNPTEDSLQLGVLDIKQGHTPPLYVSMVVAKEKGDLANGVLLLLMDPMQMLAENGKPDSVLQVVLEIQGAKGTPAWRSANLVEILNKAGDPWSQHVVLHRQLLHMDLWQIPMPLQGSTEAKSEYWIHLGLGFLGILLFSAFVWLLTVYAEHMKQQAEERTNLAHATQKRLEAILSAVPVGMVILIPRHHNVSYSNIHARKILELSLDRESDSLAMETLAPWVGDLFTKLEHGTMVDGVSRERRLGERDLKLQIYPMHFNDVASLLVTIVDVTEQKQIELELQRNQRNLQTFFETVSHLLLVLDRQGCILNANEAVKIRVGLTEAKVIGMRLIDLIAQDDRSHISRALFDALTGSTMSAEAHLLSNDGMSFPVEMRMLPGLWNGRFAVFVVAEDVSRLQESRVKFSKVFYLNSTMMALVERNTGAILEANDAFVQQLWANRGMSICGKLFWDVLSIPEHANDPEIVEALQNGRGLRGHQLSLHKDNGEPWYGVLSLEFLNIAGMDQILCVLSDITPLKQTETMLRQAERNALEASHSKSMFLANMSHEIRTPMNGVLGMTALLADTELNLEQREYLDMIHKSADALLLVINDILDFSKIEAGKLDVELASMDVLDLVESVGDVIGLKATEKGIHFVLSIDQTLPRKIVSDSLRLRQILFNLLGNAIKFTSHGDVTLQLLHTENGRICFKICDSGIGMDLNHAQFLFQPFQQEDLSTTRRFGGTGLGLAISKRLVELLGGDLQVTSQLGVGSEFDFCLPLSEEANIPWMVGFSTGSPLRGQRWLVYEEHDGHRIWQAQLLQLLGAEVVMAESFETLHQTIQNEGSWQGMLIPGVWNSAELFAALSWVPLNSTMQVIRCISIGNSGRGENSWITQPVKLQALRRLVVPSEMLPDPLTEVAVKSFNPSQGKGRLILLVEDNLVNQKLTVRILEKSGFSVDVAGDGVVALCMLQEKDYELVLMDVQMPVMDGISATRLLRTSTSNVRNPQIPVVAMTANAMEGDRERCLEAGMNDYVSKPIKPNLLLEKLQKYLG